MMGLPKALAAHASNDLAVAMREYQRAFDQDIADSRLYQNYGSLLAKSGKVEEAEAVYSKGISLFPNNHMILRNYANFHRKIKPFRSVFYYLETIKIICKDKALFSEKLYVQLCNDAVEVLQSLGLQAWAYSIVVELIKSTTITPATIKNLVLCVDSLFEDQGLSSCLDLDGELLSPVLIDNCTVVERISLYFAFAYHYYSSNLLDKAIQFYDKATLEFQRSNHLIPPDEQPDARKLINENSWNLSCLKIQLADYSGWKLFDHGLLASAMGQQRWQRALVKPFSDSEIPIWRGQSLHGKRILLLEEQAIGDAMMFFTLIPELMRISGFVAIYVSKRLVSIYKRTFASDIAKQRFAVYSRPDIVSGLLSSHAFDFQSAIGSSCQYVFNSFREFARPSLKLLSDNTINAELRNKYLQIASENSCRPFIVGVSWRGGGRPDRIKQKSLEPSDFCRILSSFPNIQFVSLQYGDVSSQCDEWSKSGIHIICDSSVNAMKDMDRWLSQVHACDAVLSVANTTIHGAGGLHKPTLCLLSEHSDWRWFNDRTIKRSYWYPTVGIARQSQNGKWSEAIQLASSWIASSCPTPEGPQFI